jgi:hypothetical protein
MCGSIREAVGTCGPGALVKFKLKSDVLRYLDYFVAG